MSEALGLVEERNHPRAPIPTVPRKRGKEKLPSLAHAARGGGLGWGPVDHMLHVMSILRSTR